MLFPHLHMQRFQVWPRMYRFIFTVSVHALSTPAHAQIPGLAKGVQIHLYCFFSCSFHTCTCTDSMSGQGCTDSSLLFLFMSFQKTCVMLNGTGIHVAEHVRKDVYIHICIASVLPSMLSQMNPSTIQHVLYQLSNRLSIYWVVRHGALCSSKHECSSKHDRWQKWRSWFMHTTQKSDIMHCQPWFQNVTIWRQSKCVTARQHWEHLCLKVSSE